MINQLLDTVEYSSAIAAYTNNEQIAKDVIQGLLRNDIVQAVNITSDQGLNLKKSQNVPALNNVQNITRQLLSPFDNKQIIGTISVTPKGDYNLVEATHSALLSAINSILLIALTTAIILLVFRRNILQPLTVVSNTLHEISAGEKQRIAPLLKNQNDELGRLVHDINELLEVLETNFKSERALREKIEHIEKQLRNIFESTSAGLFQLDQEGKILTYNPTFEKFLVKQISENHDESIGNDFAANFFEDSASFREMIKKASITKNLVANDLALRSATPEEQRWVHCLLSYTNDATGHNLYEGVIFDISSRVANERAIRYQAEYDALTGALRRDSVERYLSGYLEAPQNSPLVVMLLDLDGFKAVNDTYGHDAGDEVLIEVVQRFKNNIRATDVIGRLGGDEFVIILNKCEPINAELTIAKKIIQAVSQPVHLKSGHTVSIGVSIGMASNNLSTSTVETLMKAADETMYLVKRQGKNGFAVYKPDREIIVELISR